MNDKLFIGVDPGRTGALAFYHPASKGLVIEDMPVVVVKSGKSTKSKVDEYGLADIVRQEIAGYEPVAFVEQVGAMPGQGVTSMFSFGVSFGVVRGVLAALGIPTTYITPSMWKRSVGCPEGKDGARQRARQVFPSAAALLARKKDDGRAEAALIAYHGFKVEGY